jgi:ribosomal protein S18 acetylase RimI-like enzyme
MIAEAHMPGEIMMTTTILNQTPNTELRRVARDSQRWEIHRAQSAEIVDVKELFRDLHAFNAGLDPRFALSAEWEVYFDAAMRRAVGGNDSICLVAKEAGADAPCGFALAAIHHDSDMWRYHEWVEVEALFVEDAWRGRGLAAALLDRASEWASDHGQPVIQLYVTASNERAIQFYRRQGFRVTQEIMRKTPA